MAIHSIRRRQRAWQLLSVKGRARPATLLCTFPRTLHASPLARLLTEPSRLRTSPQETHPGRRSRRHATMIRETIFTAHFRWTNLHPPRTPAQRGVNRWQEVKNLQCHKLERPRRRTCRHQAPGTILSGRHGSHINFVPSRAWSWPRAFWDGRWMYSSTAPTARTQEARFRWFSPPLSRLEQLPSVNPL